MQYDGLVTAAVVAELGGAIAGGRISKVRQHNDTDLTIIVRSRGSDHRLFFSVDAQFPRVYLTASTMPVPDRPPRFCALLRKHIQGAFLYKISQIDFDRVIHFSIEAPDGNRTTLIFEIMGKHSNLILISDSGRILGAAKHIPASVSRYRQVLPGRDYLPPPSAGKADLLKMSRTEFEQLWMQIFPDGEPDDSEARKFLVSGLSGFGPFLAGEVVTRAGQPSVDRVWGELSSIADTVLSASYDPVIVTLSNGSIELTYPIPCLQRPPEQQHRRSSILESLDTLFRQDVSTSQIDSERSRLDTGIKRAIGAREHTLKSLQDTIAEGDRSEDYKKMGDLLLANLHSIEKGQLTARVTDYYDPEMAEVEIELDPKLSPKENADSYFRRYRKTRDGAEAAKDRILEIQEEIRLLKKALDGLPQIADVDRIRELGRTLIDRELLREESQAPQARRQEPEYGGARIRKTVSAEGYEILYGENSEANDYLTTKVASSDDIWLHARSVTGAHVVIRTNRRPDAVPPGTLRHAAEIAAANSDAKHSSLIPVDYTLRKHVRKPRRSAPGFVTYGGEKTLDVVWSKSTRVQAPSR
jgi:predicted ribosome quality control (RQC) complex YloA/Tae2 family protein